MSKSCHHRKFLIFILRFPKTSYHRKNQDFDQAYEAMIYLAKNDIDVIWQFIPFKYNQHEILKAAEMALNCYKKNLQILENEISGEEFLIFNRPTVADCTLFSTFTFSESLNLNIHNEYKNICSWYLKFKNREGSKS